MPSNQTRRERIADLIARLNVQNQSIIDRYTDSRDPAEQRELASRSAVLLRRFGRLSRSVDRYRRNRP